MKFTKCISGFILVALVLSISTGCNSKNNQLISDEQSVHDSDAETKANQQLSKLTPYTSLTCDVANDGHAVPLEWDGWNYERYYKENIPDRTEEIFGETYELTYDYSIIMLFKSYVEDVYNTADGITVKIRSDTDQIVAINYKNLEFFETVPYLPDIDNAEQYAMQKIEETALLYIDDLSDYTKVVKKPRVREGEENGKAYKITYYAVMYLKNIGDYYASDGITVQMTSKGTISSIATGDIGAFDDVEVSVDKEKLEQSIQDKISSLYGDVDSYKIEEQRIAITPDEKVPCMVSRVLMTYGSKDVPLTTGVCILTIL